MCCTIPPALASSSLLPALDWAFGATKVRGAVESAVMEQKDKDIVIASLQSLAMRNYDIDIFKDFGLVIIDEVHHTGAEVFSKAFQNINSNIILGLSATLNRKDGLRKVFEYYIGKSVYKHVTKEQTRQKHGKVRNMC